MGSESEQELKREDASWTTIKQQIEAITFSEVGDEYQANDTKLRKIRSAFDTICKINDLIVLMQNTPDPRNVERVNIQVTLSGKETLNAQIKTRIGERGKQYRSFLGLLTNYKQKKYNRLEDQQLIDLKEHYPASFIVVDLKTLLKNYNESACHEKVIRFIQETLPHCSDIHLSSILNQIAIGLIDFNDERPEYNPLEQPISDPPKSALEQLNTLGQDNNARLMHTLYAQIEKIITFAEALPENQSDEKNELLNLMRAAKKDVDTFISQNRLAQVTDFKPLVERLKFRLHSKDDVMSKHFRQWPRIIFNIITLPFLIVFKLPHSLYSTGKLRFFLAETDKEKQLKTLEDKLDKLLTP